MQQQQQQQPEENLGGAKVENSEAVSKSIINKKQKQRTENIKYYSITLVIYGFAIILAIVIQDLDDVF